MQGIPASSRATPIRYRDPKEAIEWLRAAFKFETRFVATRGDGSFAYAHLALGDQQITVTARDERSLEPADAAPRTSGERAFAVQEIASHFAGAKAAGAEVVRSLEAGAYACRDLEGHLWAFRAAKVQRLAPLLAWTRAHVPRIEKRAGLAVAAALTLIALGIPLWQLASEAPAVPSLEVSEGQALEHARFALAEEQAARNVAEAARRAALADLARERTARLDAEREAREFEAALATAREQRAAAEAPEPLDDQLTWETQVARTAESASVSAQGTTAAIMPVAVAPPPDDAPPEVAQPITVPANPVLADGQAALAKGDIAEARRQFRRLADAGVAEAALALGSTYDPVNVERSGLAPSEADPEQAKRWYRRAIELTRAAGERQAAP